MAPCAPTPASGLADTRSRSRPSRCCPPHRPSCRSLPTAQSTCGSTGASSISVEFAPVFRANPSFTSRHDTEFTMLDVELGWIESHEDVMAHEERLLAHALATVAEAHGAAIAREFGRELMVPSVPFPRVTLADAR